MVAPAAQGAVARKTDDLHGAAGAGKAPSRRGAGGRSRTMGVIHKKLPGSTSGKIPTLVTYDKPTVKGVSKRS